MQRLQLIVRSVESGTRFIGEQVSYLFIPMVIIALLEVVLRYVFNRPTIWAWDVNMQLQAALVALTGAYVFLAGGFVLVDVVIGRLMPRTRTIMSLVASIVGFFAIGMLTWLAAKGAWQSWLMNEHSSSNWAPAMYPIRFVVLGGFLLLFIALVADFCRTLMPMLKPSASGNTNTNPEGME